MANKNLFSSASRQVPTADTTNNAGGVAYSMTAKHALAQLVCTGTFNNTYYVSAEDQLNDVLELCGHVDNEFIAKLAVYARKYSFMKDMPAFLTAVLASREKGEIQTRYLDRVFFDVCDNAKMVRNFAQIIRSGVTGRKCFGTHPKKLIEKWLDSRSDDAVFRSSVGNSPSFADVINMTHPKPKSPVREALYGYLLDKKYDVEKLPKIVRDFEEFKSAKDKSNIEVPNVPFEMLTALDLDTKSWTAIARNASWQQVRMNLNTFMRHGVFEQKGMVELIVKKLTNEEEIKRAKVFPYQLMNAYLNTKDVPQQISLALQDALEIAVDNVPEIEGRVYVFPDVSGSMNSPATGYRKGATTSVTCVHVAALVAASILRKNRMAEVIPFAHTLYDLRLNPKDSIMTNAEKMMRCAGGGTDCHLPLRQINGKGASGSDCATIVYISDNESWLDSHLNGYYANYYGRAAGTSTADEWNKFKSRNKNAKMVCIDITPNKTCQVPDDKSVINIGGFSDVVFNVISAFVQNSNSTGEYWVKKIEEINLG